LLVWFLSVWSPAPPPPPHDLLDHGPPDHKGRDTRVSA
jgi:hypothetical protein